MADDAKASLLNRIKWWPFSRKRKFAELNTSNNPTAKPSRSPSAVSPVNNSKNTTPATTTPALSEVVDAPAKRLKYTPRYAERDALLSIPTAPLRIRHRSKSSKSLSSTPARFEYDFVGSAPAAFMHPNSHISLERRGDRRWRGSDDWDTPLSAYVGYGNCPGRSKSFSGGWHGRDGGHPHIRRAAAYQSTPHLRSEALQSDIPAVPALPNVGGSEPNLDDSLAPTAIARKRNKRFSAWRASHCAQQGDEEEDQRLAWEMAGVSLADEEFEEGYEDYGKDDPVPLATGDAVSPWSSEGLLPHQSSRTISSVKMARYPSVAGEMLSGSSAKALPSLQKVAAARNFSRPESPHTAAPVRPPTPVRGRTGKKGKGRASDIVSPIERLRSESPTFGPPASPPPTRALPAVPTSPENTAERTGSRRQRKTQKAHGGPSSQLASTTSATARRNGVLDPDVIDFALPPTASPLLPETYEPNGIDEDFDEEDRICSRLSGLDFGAAQKGHERIDSASAVEESALASGASAEGMDSGDWAERRSGQSVSGPGCRSPVVIRDADNGMGGWF